MATEKREPMSADLLRQRRNLLITSLVLIAINLAGAKLKQDVSVLGAAVEFSNPERIVWGAWILWGYFLVRYWQYLNEEPHLGIHEAMGRWIRNQIPTDEFEQYSYYVVWRFGVLWALYYEDHHSGQDTWHSSKRGPNRALSKGLWTIRAFTSVATKTPRFTDYVVPFFVAAIPLILCFQGFFTSKISVTG